jgi:hypothetical protein
MELRPPDAPLDAFFAPVRRRHPNVDIVVLPAQGPAPGPEPAGDAELDDVLGRVANMAGRLWAAALPTTDPPEPSWRFGPDEGTVVVSARSGLTTPHGLPALLALRGGLEGEGWKVGGGRGEVRRLAARSGDLTVQASYAEGTGAFLIEVASEPIHVGRTRARRLVRR